MLSHFLLQSEGFGCVAEALTATAMLSTENVFQLPFKDEEKQVIILYIYPFYGIN